MTTFPPPSPLFISSLFSNYPKYRPKPKQNFRYIENRYDKMEANGGISFSSSSSSSSSSSRNRNAPSPSSDRFINLFSRSQPEALNNGVSVLSSEIDDDLDDLDEDDVFWTGDDFSQSNQHRLDPPTVNRNNNQQGILAALPEDEKKRIKDGGDRKFVYRKASAVSSPSPTSPRMMIRTIPKPQSPSKRDYSFSLPSRKFHQSAPVNVPMLSRVARERESRPAVLEVDDEDEEMLPPHEIVARGSSNRSPKTTFSVLEGIGRTLKGRDLRQVRNAVWRQTGFLD